MIRKLCMYADLTVTSMAVPDKYNDMSETETAVFAGGCFWCIEAVFDRLSGVRSVVPGYTGGRTKAPTYESVCSGTTGHAEAVRIEFDPSIISYEELLTIFFSIHDPTTLNRQGPDIGSQYRSAIFYINDEQRETIERVITSLEDDDIFEDPIVTEISPLGTFHVAEEKHHDYYKKNPSNAYCVVQVEPKLSKLRKQFADKLVADAS